MDKQAQEWYEMGFDDGRTGQSSDAESIPTFKHAQEYRQGFEHGRAMRYAEPPGDLKVEKPGLSLELLETPSKSSF